MEHKQTIDDVFNFLQNKTIKDIGSDFYDNKHYLVILLSDGSIAHIFSSDNLYIAIKKHLVNQWKIKMIKHIQDINEHTKHVVDTISGITVLGTIAQILPAIAALLSIVWYAIRIYEHFKKKFKKQLKYYLI